jgi:hypothetical protein
MTTEIAVLNRLGVALAADSAVTISGGGTTKVFDSADKLFELSCTSPVALMLNGNMDCFGMPWEILVKDFRDEHGEERNKSIVTWAESFVSFAESKLSPDKQGTLNYGKQIALAELSLLMDNLQQRLFSTLRKQQRANFEQLIWPILQTLVDERRQELSKEAIADGFVDISNDTLYERYNAILNPIIEERLPI